MSYEKKTVSSNKVIRFYYLTDNVFNAVSEATSFKAASIVGEKGIAEFDRIQLGSDEKTFMKKYLKEAALKIFNPLFKIIADTELHHDSPIDLGTEVFAASLMVVGKTYIIVTPNVSTDFTQHGAADNDAGTVFICTSEGVGTGTVREMFYATYVDITDNERYRTINLDLIDQLIYNALVGFVLFKWYFLKGLDKDSQLHATEFNAYVSEMIDRSLFLRQPS